MTAVEIYTGERYYGTIRMDIARPPFTQREEDIRAEIERRLPKLKRTKYFINIL